MGHDLNARTQSSIAAPCLATDITRVRSTHRVHVGAASYDARPMTQKRADHSRTRTMEGSILRDIS